MEWINIGSVANTHGVRGDIKIYPLTDDPSRFELLDKITLDLKGKIQVLTITNIKYFKNLIIISSKELNSMDDAMAFKTALVKIPMDEALPLEDDENYIFQLIGMDVYDQDDENLGKIKNVLTTGAHDVYVIDDASKNGLMIPATKDFVLKVDVEANRMVVRLIEGLKGL